MVFVIVIYLFLCAFFILPHMPFSLYSKSCPFTFISHFLMFKLFLEKDYGFLNILLTFSLYRCGFEHVVKGLYCESRNSKAASRNIRQKLIFTPKRSLTILSEKEQESSTNWHQFCICVHNLQTNMQYKCIGEITICSL